MTSVGWQTSAPFFRFGFFRSQPLWTTFQQMGTDLHWFILKWDRRNWSISWHLLDKCRLLEDMKWDKISIAKCLNLGVWTLKQCGLALYSKPCLVGRTHTIISIREVPLPQDFCGKGHAQYVWLFGCPSNIDMDICAYKIVCMIQFPTLSNLDIESSSTYKYAEPKMGTCVIT
jgi:hypothetical protein